MTRAAWLLFCATETVLCLTPGPAVLLVVSLALARSLQCADGAPLIGAGVRLAPIGRP